MSSAKLCSLDLVGQLDPFELSCVLGAQFRNYGG
jgi:hypothetical protein